MNEEPTLIRVWFEGEENAPFRWGAEVTSGPGSNVAVFAGSRWGALAELVHVLTDVMEER